MALTDSLGLCLFAAGNYSTSRIRQLLTAMTGLEWTSDDYRTAGERIFNLERMFNYREGFTRQDDRLPDRFFEEAPTFGSTQGAVLDRGEFTSAVDRYHATCGWDPETGRPTDEKLESLGLSFVL